MLKYTEDTENAPYYPDAIAVAYDDNSNKVTAVYSDRSLFLWDIHDLKKIGKYRSFIYHSECVWGIEVRRHMHTYAILFFLLLLMIALPDHHR